MTLKAKQKAYGVFYYPDDVKEAVLEFERFMHFAFAHYKTEQSPYNNISNLLLGLEKEYRKQFGDFEKTDE